MELTRLLVFQGKALNVPVAVRPIEKFFFGWKFEKLNEKKTSDFSSFLSSF